MPALVGVSLNNPVELLNKSPGGILPVTLKLAALDEVGWKLYVLPTVALEFGVPEMVGRDMLTVMEKAASLAVRLPLTAAMVMLLVVPTSEPPGVPLKAPVAVLNVAQAGLLVMVKLAA